MRVIHLVPALLMLVGTPAWAGGVPAPLCRQRDVLDFAARNVASHMAYADLIWGSVVESPTAAPDTVLCTATVKVTQYDYARAGAAPELRWQTRTFTVRRLQQGFEVSLP